MTKLLKIFHIPLWLFWVLVVVLILRIPNFFEAYSYGDELIYLSLGEAIRQKIPLYLGIHDNKPPLLYITAAIAGNLFWFKALLTLWSLVTVFIFYKLSQTLFPKKNGFQKVATIIFATLTTIPLLEGNIANAENFMIGFSMLGFLILLTKKPLAKTLLFSGFLFSIATLFKVPAAFDIPAIILYWLVIEKKLNNKSVIKISKNTFILFLGFLVPIAITFVWYYFRGAFQEYLIAAWLQNFGYLSSWRPSDVQEPFLVRNGPLLMRSGVVAVLVLVLLRFKEKLSKKFIFISTWLFLTLFAVTLSERPYPHYLLQSVPAISLLAGILLTSQKKEQILSIIPLAISVFVPFYFHFWHYETWSYYHRFVNFSLRNISYQEYLTTFGSHVPRNYAVAEFVASSSRKGDKIFVWGDGVAIYVLSKRLPPLKYVADYHIKDFSSNVEVMSSLYKDPPVFIIIQPGNTAFSELNNFITKNYGLVNEIEGAKIWKLLSPEVRALFSY